MMGQVHPHWLLQLVWSFAITAMSQIPILKGSIDNAFIEDTFAFETGLSLPAASLKELLHAWQCHAP